MFNSYFWLSAIREFPWLFTFFAFWLGCNIGSFLNVCAWRIPNKMSVISPPSHCPKCDYVIKFYENVPIFGWLFLKGRCSSCGDKISARYIIAELVTGIIFAAIFYKVYVVRESLWYLWFYFFGASIAVCAALSDCDYRIIPNEFTYLLIVFGIAYTPLLMPSWTAYFLMLGWMAFVFVFLFLFAKLAKLIFKRDAFGMGDVKYLAGTAAFLMPVQFLVMLLFACIIALIFTPFYRMIKPKYRYRAIPFGPFISISFILMLIFNTLIAKLFAE